jgi:hypothetical protein
VEDNQELVRLLDGFIADLQEVDPPDDRREDYEIWLTDQRQIAKEIKEAAQTGDRERAQGVDTSSADAKSRELGFDDCD